MKIVPPTPLIASGRPRYAVLAQTLMDEIRAGRYPLGSLLPTEFDLCQQFNVSRHTVREAIRRLVDLGLVARQPGVGTRVKATRLASRYVQASDDISDLFQYVRDVVLRVEETEDIIADAEIAEFLECKPGQGCLHARGARFVAGDEPPISLTDIYIARAYRGIAAEIREPQIPIYAIIERRFGLVTAEVRQQISAVRIEGAAAERLLVPPGSPGLQIIRKYVSSNEETFEVTVNLHPGDRFSYSTALRVERRGDASAG
jgi:DNA-binding GntR family transcriptional regulator